MPPVVKVIGSTAARGPPVSHGPISLVSRVLYRIQLKVTVHRSGIILHLTGKIDIAARAFEPPNAHPWQGLQR